MYELGKIGQAQPEIPNFAEVCAIHRYGLASGLSFKDCFFVGMYMLL